MNAPVSDHALPHSAVGAPLPLRFFDVLLVVAFLPFALLAGLPALGSIAGVALWIVLRSIGVTMDLYAAGKDVRTATAITFAGGMLRPLLLGLTILAIGSAGEREDGLTAALINLVAFTIYMVLSFIFRPQRNPST